MDLFPEAVPKLEAFLKWGYGFVTTNFPKAWELMYNHAERQNDPGNLGWNWFGDLHRHMSRHLEAIKPAAVLSTFPMYPYLLAEKQWGIHRPKFCGTVVTDSISINSVWTHAPTDRFFVTDEFSAQSVVARGVKPDKIEATGFAVTPRFTELAPRALEASQTDKFRILYFATASATQVKETLLGLLREGPAALSLTVSLGRHEARLGKMVRAVCAEFPQRESVVLGWTNDVPGLLVKHDLVISKGGGATVHEGFASATPMLVNYFIPGQEAGNVELLKRRGCGWYQKETTGVGRNVSDLIASGAWAEAKRQMLHHRNPDGAVRIARRTIELAGLSI